METAQATKYKVGDLYRSDFDYDGMLRMGAEAKVNWGEEKLQKLFNSFESVNYHTESQPLWRAISALKEGDSDTAKTEMDEFNMVSQEALGEYTKGGSTESVWIATMLTSDNTLLSERFDKPITHKELYDKYKSQGYEIKDAQINKATNPDVLESYKNSVEELVQEKYGEDVDWNDSLISYDVIGNKMEIRNAIVRTTGGSEYTITPQQVAGIKNMAKGGNISSKDRQALKAAKTRQAKTKHYHKRPYKMGEGGLVEQGDNYTIYDPDKGGSNVEIEYEESPGDVYHSHIELHGKDYYVTDESSQFPTPREVHKILLAYAKEKYPNLEMALPFEKGGEVGNRQHIKKIISAIKKGTLVLPEHGGEKNWRGYRLSVQNLIWARNFYDGYKVSVYNTADKHIGDFKIPYNLEDGFIYYVHGEEMAKGGEIDSRMYNFLKDDLKELEKAISEGDNEEVERLFTYWGYHLKSLKTKTNDRMYNFLEDDLKKLEKAVSEGDNEEVERFFIYWGYHLKSLKMAKGGGVEDERENLEYFLSYNNDDVYWEWVNGEISDQEAINLLRDIDGIEYDKKINYKEKMAQGGGVDKLPSGWQGDLNRMWVRVDKSELKNIAKRLNIPAKVADYHPEEINYNDAKKFYLHLKKYYMAKGGTISSATTPREWLNALDKSKLPDNIIDFINTRLSNGELDQINLSDPEFMQVMENMEANYPEAIKPKKAEQKPTPAPMTKAIVKDRIKGMKILAEMGNKQAQARIKGLEILIETL